MIVGFNYTKITVEKTARPQGKIKVNNGLDITSVTKQPLAVARSKDVLTFTFTFTVTYNPSIGTIALTGDVTYLADPATITSTLDTWNKTKKISPQVSTEVLNIILTKCNIRALELAQELNLPAHLPLPNVNPQAEDPKHYIG